MSPAEYWRAVEERQARGQRAPEMRLSDIYRAFWDSVDERTGGAR